MVTEKQQRLTNAENDLKATAESIISNAKMDADKIIALAKSEAETIVVQTKLDAAVMAKEISEWENEKEKIAKSVTFDKIIQLNVGGHKFDTKVHTMTRFPESMLGAMFSGRHTLDIDKDGYYFIDQDGTHFRHILNFLRNPEGFVITLKGEEFAELKNQAAYYLLEDKMFPYGFEKRPPQALLIYSRGIPQNVTVTVVQDEKGIWKVDSVSHDTVKRFFGRHVIPSDIQICTSCLKGYTTVNDDGSKHYFYKITLPLVKDQPVRSKCDNCKY